MATTKELEKQIEDLRKYVSELEETIVNVPNAAVKPDVDATTLSRDSLRLAMVNAGMVRKEHARADAQQVDKAIDDILSAWGE